MVYSEKTVMWRIINSWWVLFSFVFLINWLGILIAGLIVRKKEWMGSGVLYLIPNLVLFFTVQGADDVGNGFWENLMFVVFFLAWIGSIIHSFRIVKPYLLILAEGNDFLDQADRKMSINKVEKTKQATVAKYSKAYTNILDKVYNLQVEILNLLEDTKKSDLYLVNELTPMVEDYVKKTEELIERETALSKSTEGMSVGVITRKVNDLREKFGKTDNPMLRDQYERNIEKLESKRKTLNELNELSSLKLEFAVSALEQVKLDLLKYHGMNDENKRSEFFDNMATKSTELNEYVTVLKNTYDEFQL